MTVMFKNEKNKFSYCVIWDDEPGNDGLEPDYSFDSIWDKDDLEQLAEDAAEDYQHNHDGWEADWPLKFAIFEDDTLLGKCEVEREYSPTFSAWVIA